MSGKFWNIASKKCYYYCTQFLNCDFTPVVVTSHGPFLGFLPLREFKFGASFPGSFFSIKEWFLEVFIALNRFIVSLKMRNDSYKPKFHVVYWLILPTADGIAHTLFSIENLKNFMLWYGNTVSTLNGTNKILRN